MAADFARPYITRMTDGHLALTEKERETLRLLVQGYDAKSMARHLGLSVHTVNERLRDARRKMATSSSREAARLLREAEEQTPELLGDKVFGGASAALGPQMSGQPAQGRGILRRTGWIVGGIIMSISLALLALSALSGPVQAPATPTVAAAAAASTPATEARVTEAARQWLALLDRDDWSASWAATGEAFRSLNTEQRWTESSRQVRDTFGAIKSRRLIAVNYAPAPPYGYWVLKYRADYARQPQAIETLSLAWDHGTWKVVGITVE